MINKNVYILSLEGAAVYEHMHRGKYIKKDYVGMLPYSLELMQLEKQGLKVFTSKRTDKVMSNDIINVQFNQKVRSSDEIIKILEKKIINNKVKDVDKTKEYIEELKTKTDWIEIKNDDLRTKLYKEGFTITEVNKDGEIKETEYVVYKRSSAKSRTGQCLFMKKQLKDKMVKWARMGMNLDGRDDIDYPSLLSYESLVSSSLEDTVHIDVNNILIVSDVKSVFNANVNIVEKDENGLLINKPVDGYKMESDIFDGEGLLDKSIFIKANRENKGMMLLRQHMFKSCVFNTNIQDFLRDNCPEGQDYNTWELTNMFGETILAKNVHMIITPNSLKALKFSKVKGSKPKMWQHWKSIVSKEGSVFGICKSEKASKRGVDAGGNILNQTSYQMLNSMPISLEDMEGLSRTELEYIEKLKNDDSTYIEYLIETKNDVNCNEMLVDLYKRNKSIANTKIFKDKRKKDINNYKNYVQKGKLRLKGDYCTIMQNGKELLYHAIGKLPIDNKGILQEEKWQNDMILKKNEIYTTLHPFNREYVGFRNPHTAPSNVLIVKNKRCDFIEKYFNLTDNIIYTNAISFEINRILSGQDVDSDNLVLFNDETLLQNAKECYGHYRVCVNNVGTDTNKYTVCATDMAKIDNILAKSQEYIGTVVNLGQLFLSTYWDLKNKGETDTYKLDRLLEGVDICTVLSEISIDSAKRMYDVDIEQQIKHLKKNKYLNTNKPLFFKYVSKNEKIHNKIEKYETSMDYLQEVMENIDVAEGRDTIDLAKLLKDLDGRKVKRRQVEGIIKAITDMSNEIKSIESTYNRTDEDAKKEKYNALDNVKSEHMHKIKKYKIKAETVYVIIKEVFRDRIKCKYKIELLNVLYNTTNKEVFLEVFKEK